MHAQLYTVLLVSVGPRRVELMKAIRTLLPELGLTAAKQLVDQVPVTISRCWPEPAHDIAQALRALGAEVKVFSPNNEEYFPEVVVPMEVPESALAVFREAGLLVSEPDVPNHVWSPLGVGVFKPEHAGGNSLPDYEAICIEEGERLVVDAPGIGLFGKNGRWFVEVHEWVPGPGPGDFIHEYAQVEEAVADVLDYFFGDPSRMQEQLNYQRPTPEETMASDRTDDPCRVPGCSDRRVTFSAFCPHHHDQMLSGKL